MTETETEAQGQKPKTSKLGIGEMVAAVIVVLLIIAILWPVCIRLSEYRRRIRCGENIEWLGKAMLIYACGHDEKYPTPDKWCDLLIKYAEVTEKEFVCPSAGEGRCHYAINPNASAVTNPGMVVLFETKGGWNQFGGPEILTFENHKGKGCNISFNDFHVEFVKPNQLGELKWKDNQKQ
jgi:prepilin-type processing-associated H-X9-DG protein